MAGATPIEPLSTTRPTGTAARRHAGLWSLAALLAASAGLTCASLALAQPEAANAKAPAIDADVAAVQSKARALLKDYTSRAIVRLGLLDLRLRPDPTPEDYRIAALVMTIGDAVQPGEAETLRRIADCSWNGTDEQAAIDATTRLVQADPTDRVAILRVVSATIARMQTAEERLAAYEKLLGSGGARLPAVVRSRLALDCALLMRERGDEQGFIDRLQQATSLDATNKEAALLASAYYAERSTDPMGRLEMLANLLYSDPMDPGVHDQLSASLAQGGAFVGAKRLWNNARTLMAQGARERGYDAEVRSLVHDWLAGGATDIVRTLNKRLAADREVKARQIEAQTRSGVSLTDAGKVEDQRLAQPVDRVRVLAALASGDRITYETGCVDLARSGLSLLKEANDPQIELLMPRDEALAFAQRAQITAELVAAICGVTGPELTENLTSIESSGLADDPRLAVARVARAMETLGTEAAMGELLKVDFAADESGEAEAAASILVAEALKKQNKREQAAGVLRQTARKHILLPMGALAWNRYQQIKGPDERLTAQAAAMDAFADNVPRWIDQAINDPRSMMALDVQLEKTTLPALQRPVAKVRIRNVSPIPLSLGPDRTINSRLIFAPRMDVGIAAMGQLALPEIVEADRRLRLEPNETLEFDAFPDIGFTGWLSESACADVVRCRWRVLQGFRSNEQGVIEQGPGCLSTETAALVKNPLPEATLDPAELPERVRTRDESELLPIAVVLRARTMSLGAIKEDDKDRGALVEQAKGVIAAFVERYPTLSPLARQMLLTVLPQQTQFPAMADFDRLALQDQDPKVLAIALVTRCADPADAALAAAAESADPMLREVARLHKARLAGAGMCYARLTPDITAFNPPAETAP